MKEKNGIRYILVGLAVVVFGVFWYRDHGEFVQPQDEMSDIFERVETSEPNASPEDEKVYVHIVGAVKKPGVYAFDQEPRVVEVVEKAGGFTKNAEKSGVNQAEIVADGSQIVIESKQDRKKADDEEGNSAQQTAESDPDRVNINTATKEELMTLSGIGESKAVSIITYRETNGKFNKVEDIMNITGIKTGVFDKIKDRIKV